MNNIPLKTEEVILISEKNFSEFVSSYYGKPYRFQQQDGCREKGIHKFTVPCERPADFIKTEVSSRNFEGISFYFWLDEEVSNDPDSLFSDINFWHRNFYPSLDMVINDLYENGLIKAGNYIMEIDW